MKIEPKGAKREPQGTKMEPKEPKRQPKGAKRDPKEANGRQKEAKREPKASQREPKASQRRTKMPKQIYARKKVPKRSDHGDEIGHFWSHFDELKTLKSVVLSSISCFFVIFEKVEKILKKGAVARSIFDDFWIHFQFPGLPKPHFSRDCYRRVTC